MIKEALKYIVDLKKPQVVDVHGSKYSHSKLDWIIGPLASEMDMNTLDGIVQYLLQNPDQLKSEEIIIRIISEGGVSVQSKGMNSHLDRSLTLSVS